MKKIILILLIIMLIPQIQALGIAPAQTETLELSQTYNLKIINNLNQEFTAIITPTGQLSQYITISNPEVEFNQEKEFEIVQITTNIPREQLNTGKNIITITVSQQFDTSSQVAAQISLTHDLIIINSTPQPEIEFEILTSNFEPNKKGTITLRATNTGLQQTNIISTLTINQETQQKTQIIEGLQTTNINFEWTPTTKGKKEINAKIQYEDKTIQKTKTVLVGLPQITIQKITPNLARLGDVARIDLELESDWEQQINAQITANIAKISSNTEQITITPNTKESVSLLINTAGLTPGNYDLQIQLNYEGIQTQKTYKTIITNNNIHILDQQETTQTKEDYNFTLIISVLLIIIIAIILYKKLINTKTHN